MENEVLNSFYMSYLDFVGVQALGSVCLEF